MLKTIKFIGYLLYRYYSKGRDNSIARFHTLCAMTFLAFLHIFQLLILLEKADLISTAPGNNKSASRIAIFFMMLPVYLVLSRVFSKKDIAPLKEKYDYDWDKVFKGNVWLVIYFCLSFLLILILAFIKKV